jgi:hypothetical protein
LKKGNIVKYRPNTIHKTEDCKKKPSKKQNTRTIFTTNSIYRLGAVRGRALVGRARGRTGIAGGWSGGIRRGGERERATSKEEQESCRIPETKKKNRINKNRWEPYAKAQPTGKKDFIPEGWARIESCIQHCSPSQYIVATPGVVDHRRRSSEERERKRARNVIMV